MVRERGGTPFWQISLATGGTLTLKRSGKLPPNAGFGIKNLKKNFPGMTPRIPSAGGATPSRTHPQHGYTPCAVAQAPPLLGSRSRKPFPQIKIYHYTPVAEVVSVLNSGAKGPGFKSQPRRSPVTVLGKVFTPIVRFRASVHQAVKLVAALLRVARVTAGLAESNGSLPPGL